MRCFAFAILLCLCFTATAQRVDEFMLNAKKHVQTQHYETADSVLKVALESYPDHHDIFCYRARVQSWMGDLVKADSIIDQVFLLFPNDLEASEIRATLVYWSGDAEKLLGLAREYSARFPDHLGFRYYIAFGLHGIGMNKESLEVLDQILADDPGHVESGRLRNSIRLQYYNFIDTELRYTSFDQDLKPWVQARVGYGMNKKIPWNVHITSVNRFGKSGTNFQAEAYPRLGRHSYLHLDASYAPNDFMANFTAGFGLFHRWQDFEIGLGSKMYSFSARTFYLSRASIGYYHDKFSIQYQSLFTSNTNRYEVIHLLRGRIHINPNHYLESELVSGANVQDYVNAEGELTPLEIYGAALNYGWHLKDKFNIVIATRLTAEEFRPSDFRSRFDTSIRILRRF